MVNSSPYRAAGQPIEVVRQVHDEIRHRVDTLLAELLPTQIRQPRCAF